MHPYYAKRGMKLVSQPTEKKFIFCLFIFWSIEGADKQNRKRTIMLEKFLVINIVYVGCPTYMFAFVFIRQWFLLNRPKGDRYLFSSYVGHMWTNEITAQTVKCHRHQINTRWPPTVSMASLTFSGLQSPSPATPGRSHYCLHQLHQELVWLFTLSRNSLAQG